VQSREGKKIGSGERWLAACTLVSVQTLTGRCADRGVKLQPLVQRGEGGAERAAAALLPAVGGRWKHGNRRCKHTIFALVHFVN
jgi:hypothetical protein